MNKIQQRLWVLRYCKKCPSYSPVYGTRSQFCFNEDIRRMLGQGEFNSFENCIVFCKDLTKYETSCLGRMNERR